MGQAFVGFFQLGTLSLEHGVGLGELRRAIGDLGFETVIEVGELARHFIEFVDQRIQFGRRFDPFEFRVEFARLNLFNAAADACKWSRDQVR